MNLNNETKNIFSIPSKTKIENSFEPQKLINYKTKSQLKSISSLQSKNTQTVSNNPLERIQSPRDKKILTLQNFKKEENLLFNLTKTETMTEFLSSKFFSLSHRPFVKNNQNLANKSKRKMSHSHKLNELVLQLNQNLESKSNLSENSQSLFIHKYMLHINNLLKSNSHSPDKNTKNSSNVTNIKDNKLNTIQNFRDELDAYKKFLESTSSRHLLEQNANIILKNSGFYKYNFINSDEKNSKNFMKNSESPNCDMKNPSAKINSYANTISGNKYLNKVLQNVLRRVCYVNNRNEKITENYVVNLIKEEASDISKNLDNIFESICKIKNFSHVMAEKDETFLFPFINSIIEKKNSTSKEIKEESKQIVENLVELGNLPNFPNSKRNIKKSSQIGIFSTNPHTNTNSLHSLTSINSLNSFKSITTEHFYSTLNNINNHNLTTINENTEDSKRLNTKTHRHLQIEKNDIIIERNKNQNNFQIIENFHSGETSEEHFKSGTFENLNHETEENHNRIISSRSRRFSSLNNSHRFNSVGNLPRYSSSENLSSLKNFNKNEIITDLLKNQKILDWLKLNLDEKDSKFYVAHSSKNLNKINSRVQSSNKNSEDKKSNQPINQNLSEPNENQIHDENEINFPETPENNTRNKSKSVLLRNRRNTLTNKENLEKLKRERYSSFKKYNTEMKSEFESSEKFRSCSNKLIRQFYDNENDEKNENANEDNEETKSLKSQRSESFSVKNTVTISEEDKKILDKEKISKMLQEKDMTEKFDRKRSKKLDSIAINILNQKLEQELEENQYFLLDPNKKNIFNNNPFDEKDKNFTKRKSNLKVDKNEKGKGISKQIKSKASFMKKDSNLFINSNPKSILQKKISSKLSFNENSKSNQKKTKFFSKLKIKSKINPKTNSNPREENLDDILSNPINNDELNLLSNSRKLNEENENHKDGIDNEKNNSSSENSLFHKLNQIENQDDNQNKEDINDHNNKSSIRFNPLVQTEEFSILDTYEDKEDDLTNDNLNDSKQNFDPNSEIKDLLESMKKRDKSRTLVPKKMKPTRQNKDLDVEKEKIESNDRVKILADLIDQNLTQQITRRNAKKYTYTQ